MVPVSGCECPASNFRRVVSPLPLRPEARSFAGTNLQVEIPDDRLPAKRFAEPGRRQKPLDSADSVKSVLRYLCLTGLDGLQLVNEAPGFVYTRFGFRRSGFGPAAEPFRFAQTRSAKGLRIGLRLQCRIALFNKSTAPAIRLKHAIRLTAA